jgi:uncharacterized membrane protein
MSKNKGIYFKTGKYPGDVLKMMKNTNATGSIINKSKYSVKGAIAGGLIGFVTFSFLNKSKFAGTTIGALIGAIAGNVYNKIDENIKLFKEYKSSQILTTTTNNKENAVS